MTIFIAQVAGLGRVRALHLPCARSPGEAMEHVYAGVRADPRQTFVALYEAWRLDLVPPGPPTPSGRFYWTGIDKDGPRIVDEVITCRNNNEARRVVLDAGIKDSVLYRLRPVRLY